MNLGLKFLLCQKENVLASKGNQLSIANFRLQWKDACKTVGKSVSVTRMVQTEFSVHLHAILHTYNIRTILIFLLALPIFMIGVRACRRCVLSNLENLACWRIIYVYNKLANRKCYLRYRTILGNTNIYRGSYAVIYQ